MGGRPVTKRSEPAQQIDLLLAEPRDIHEGLRSAQNREQTQQQHLGERINDFAALARIGQILEMIQKNNALADRPQCFRSRPHRILRQRIIGSRQIQHFSDLSRTSSPDHPGY